MGWGKVRSRPATTEEKLIYLQQDFDRYKEMADAQIDELVESLMQSYLSHPNDDTKKILISYLGSEFFNRNLTEPIVRTDESGSLSQD